MCDGEQESVLVLHSRGLPPAPQRRRRRPRPTPSEPPPPPLPLVRATVVRAGRPLDSAAAAAAWLEATVADGEKVDALLGDAAALLSRAVVTHAVVSADPHPAELRPEMAAAARIGFGEGEQLAEGRFAAARDVDPRVGGGSARRRRAAELAPQERVAAVLRGRQQLDACELLLLRARADLMAGREREAVLQLRLGLETLLAELPGEPGNADHNRDIALLRERRAEARDAADLAVAGQLDSEALGRATELLEVCERVLRRRRVLGG